MLLTKEHILFPKISQFSNVVHNVRQRFKQELVLPIVKYTGRIKLHGTNSSIVFLPDGEFYCQSRSRIITPDDDNAGFASYVHRNIDRIKSALEIPESIPQSGGYADDNSFTVYGEWCGGNIQSGVAISQLPKMFVVFGVRSVRDDSVFWCSPVVADNPDLNLFGINSFPTYELEVDFNSPHLAQARLVELTELVEARCPVGAYFGIEGTGEGLVFDCDRSAVEPEFWSFKSKGEAHSKSKVKTVGVVDLEKIEQIEELVNYLLYHDRLEDRPTQAIRVLKESGLAMVSMKDVKAFIDWIAADIIAENSLEIEQSGLKKNDVIAACVRRAKIDYQAYLKDLGIVIVEKSDLGIVGKSNLAQLKTV
jgi:RNA ligase